VPGIIVELTTAVVADKERAATVDDTSGATFDGALDSGLGVLDVVPTSVDAVTVSAATVVEGADDAVAVGPLAVAGSAFSPVEHAVTAKYIHTPSPMRTSARWLHRWLRSNSMPLLLSPMQRFSRRLVALGTVALVTMTTACGGNSDTTASSTDTVAPSQSPASASEAPVIIDSADVALPVLPARTPVLPAEVVGADDVAVRVTDVSRIIVLNGAIAEIVVALGFADAIVGRDGTTVLPALADVTKVSNGHDITTESILSLAPTLVIGDTRSGPPESIEQLRLAGVPVLITPEAWTLSSMPERVTLVAAALGVPQSGVDLNAATDASITVALRGTQTLPSVPRVAFLYVRGTASVYLLGGKGSGADELIAAVGGIDVGKERGLGNYTPLTSEALVSANPDVLLVMTNGLTSVGDLDGLLSLPGIAETTAALNRAVVAVDDDLLLSFGPRTGGLIEKLSESFAAVMAPR
jgi:iron complex transport system substrate-binding protein